MYVSFNLRYCKNCYMIYFNIFISIINIIIYQAVADTNNFPIIGIFTQPSISRDDNCNGDCLYLAASYVKYIESAGARVVPINYYATNEELDALLSSINGVLLPGGGSTFPSSVQYVYDKVVELNNNNNYFPLWGTCLGFEWIVIAQSNNVDILDPKIRRYDAQNLSIPLQLTPNYKNSKLFRNAPEEIISILTTENVTLNSHHQGINPDHFEANPLLNNFFSIVSTNHDRNGLEFVSTIEAYDYPIIGTQWHPEKNVYEWGKDLDGSAFEDINHSMDAVLISQYMTNYFVNLTRSNLNSFPSEAAEDAALIYNYATTHTRKNFVQSYFFANDFRTL